MLGCERSVNSIIWKCGVLTEVLTSALNNDLAMSRVVNLSFAVRSLWGSVRHPLATVQMCRDIPHSRVFYSRQGGRFIARHLLDGFTSDLQDVLTTQCGDCPAASRVVSTLPRRLYSWIDDSVRDSLHLPFHEYSVAVPAFVVLAEA